MQTALLTWYARHGRHDLPWRTNRHPYRIVVAEFMLQQTQVDRVVPLFEAFVALFPSFAALADAPLADAVRAWKGLGYNSRAVRLHRLATIVRDAHAGELPREVETLAALPGIGPYTLRAIRAFAFDADEAPIDTNVRRIVHRAVFGIEHPQSASQRELDAAATALVPRGRGFDWNSALMDLGATVCTARAPKCLVCPLRDTCAAAPIDAAELARRARDSRAPAGPQERLPFELTTRFMRGRIVDRLRSLGPGVSISFLDLSRDLAPVAGDRTPAEIEAIVLRLQRDGIVEPDSGGWRLAR